MLIIFQESLLYQSKTTMNKNNTVFKSEQSLKKKNFIDEG